MGASLLSKPIGAEEIPHLRRAGDRLRAVRENRGISRAALADATGLNPKSIYRIEVGARRTRARTLRVIAEVLSTTPDKLAAELEELCGPVLAPESAYVERVEARRVRRLRRIQVLQARELYAAQRAAIEAEWAARTASHLRFRAAMRLFDSSFRALRRLGYL